MTATGGWRPFVGWGRECFRCVTRMTWRMDKLTTHARNRYRSHNAFWVALRVPQLAPSFAAKRLWEKGKGGVGEILVVASSACAVIKHGARDDVSKVHGACYATLSIAPKIHTEQQLNKQTNNKCAQLC